MDYYQSLDSLLFAYQKFCEITRFEVTKDSKFIITKNKKILKEGFHEIKDKDVFVCHDNAKNRQSIEFVFNKNPKSLSSEGFYANSDIFIKKTQKNIGRKTYWVFSVSE